MWMPTKRLVALNRLVLHFNLLKIRKLLQMEFVDLTVDHRTYCEIADDVLKQDEDGHDDGGSAFQWRDYSCFIEQQEEHKRRLQQQS